MTSWQERMAWILTHRLAWQNGDRVYHAFSHREEGGETGARWFVAKSICGETLSHWSGEGDHRKFTMFDEKTAAKIARPCKHCYEVRDDATSV
jgi:hypothetical protein